MKLIKCLHLLITFVKDNLKQIQLNQVTSGIKRAAAERSGYRGLSLPAVVLDDELVALHQPLADKLLKDLRGTHHRAFILPPGRESHTPAHISTLPSLCNCSAQSLEKKETFKLLHVNTIFSFPL